MELIIPSDDSKKPMYEQIYEYIKNEIKTAKLHKGEKLPSTSKLAAEINLIGIALILSSAILIILIMKAA